MKNNDCPCCTRLSVCNLGMAVGIVWGIQMFLFAILTMLNGMGAPVVDVASSVYWGLDATIIGAVIGLFWGFVSGFITGALIAYFYNLCAARCPCKYCQNNRKCCK